MAMYGLVSRTVLAVWLLKPRFVTLELPGWQVWRRVG
jgi:hypothetical protein